MSTPLIEPQKGFIFTPNPTPSSILLPAWVRLEPGVHTLMVSWDGYRPLIIFRSATQTHAGRTEIDRVPEGTGRRHRMVVGVDVRAGEDCWVTLMQAAGPAPESSRASMIVFSTPLAGGG